MWPWQKRMNTNPDCASVIGPAVRIKGVIESDGDMTIYGRVEGDIVHSGRLVIGEGAQCTSDIEATAMEVSGEVHGNLQVRDRLVLRSTARLHGDTRCGSLQIEAGAIFSGTNHLDDSATTVQRVSEPVGLPGNTVLKAASAPVGASESEPAETPAFHGGFAPTDRTP